MTFEINHIISGFSSAIKGLIIKCISKVLLVTVCWLLVINSVSGQALNDYRTNGNTTFAAATNWQRYDGTAWVAAATAPTSASNVITIRNAHTATVTAAVSIDQTVVDAGGILAVSSGQTLTIAAGPGTDLTVNGTINNSEIIASTGTIVFNAGSTYNHTQDGNDIPTAAWDTNSTCIIKGVTNNEPGGLNQSFGNFIWNCTGQTGTNLSIAALTTVNGNFTVASTNTGSIRLANFVDRTLNVSGDFNVNGGIFNVSINSGNATINVGGDFNMTAGTIAETGSASGLFVFNDAGTTQNFRRSGGTISGTVNFTVNSNVTIDFGDNDRVEGGGTFTLSNGATLQTSNTSGINGSIQTTGRSLSTSANYTFDGTSSQNTGSYLPATINNFTINNANGVTLSQALTVNGTYTSNGQFSTGSDIIFNGPTNCGGAINASNGTVTYNNATPNIIAGTYYHLTIAASVTTATLCNAITVNRNLAINGTATLYTNTYQITGNATGTFTMASGSTLRLGNTGSATAVAFPTTYAAGNTSLNSNSTVIYQSNGNQTVSAVPTYGNLTTATGGTKTLANSITVNGNVLIGSGSTLYVSASSYNITVQGNWTHDNGATFNQGNGRVIFSGGNNQTIDGNPDETFYDLMINKTGGAITLSGNLSVDGTLIMTAGNIVTGSNTLIISSTSASALNHTSGTVIGKLRRGVVTTGANYLFPVGTAGYYRPAIFNFSALSASTNITAEFIESSPGSFTPYLDDGTLQLDDVFNDGYWGFNSSSVPASYTYSLSLDGDGFSSFVIDANSRISGRNAGSPTWQDFGTHGSVDIPNSTITRTGINNNLNTTSFDYCFAMGCSITANAGADVAICTGSSTTLNGSGGGSYSWSPAYGLSATNIPNPVASPGVTTTYTLTITSGGCIRTDDVIVTVNPLPAAALGYAYQKTITIDHNQVSGGSDLYNFPVLISITDINLRDHVLNPNGYDVVFTDLNYNRLAHELESYDAATGTLVAWVRIPVLSASSNTPVRILYGNPQIIADPSTTDTWGPEYSGVWHMSDLTDATINGNDGTNGGSTSAAGLIGLVRQFNGASRIDIPRSINLEPTNNLSVSMWIRRTGGQNQWAKPLWYGRNDVNPWGPYGFEFDNNSDNSIYFHVANNTTAGNVLSATVINDGIWYLLTGTFDGSTVRFYLNNNLIGAALLSGPMGHYNAIGLTLGNRSTGGQGFTGYVDEVKISSVTRPIDWIRTEYNNQNSPSTFYSISSEAGCSVYSFTDLCSGSPIPYSVPNTGGHTYNWSIVGGVPSATTGNSITVTWGAAGPYTIQLQETAGACTGSSLVYNVTVTPQPVAQTITKIPNVTDICITGSVSATFSGGSGGVTPTNEYESTIDGGITWLPYTSGSSLSSGAAGANMIQVRTRRTSMGTGCSASGYNTVTWNTIAQPVAQTITRNPNVPDVCITGSVSATFSGGSGGVTPTDEYESTINGGATWLPYTSGSSLSSGTAGANMIQVRTRRTSTGTGCNASGYNTVTWNTIAQPVAQTITKIPNVVDVCITGSVSATFSGGSGGVNPTDEYESSIDGGITWLPYTSGSSLSTGTAGANMIQVRTRRTSSGTGCIASGYNTVTWNTIAQPVAPVLNVKTPDLAAVCTGQQVSATFFPGSGGVGCTDSYQYRLDGAGGWNAYPPGNNLSTAGHTLVEIQGQRTGCLAGAGCTGTAPVLLASWTVNPQPTGPTLNTRSPALATVCEGQAVSATFTAGNGGAGCSDSYQYRYDGAGAWNAYTPGNNISTAGHTLVEIQGQRTGCTPGSGCSGTAWVTLTSWVINPQPTGPTLDLKIPDVVAVCDGELVSATFNPGLGGVSCSDSYQYRFDGAGGWNAYIPGNDINTTGHTLLEIQGQRSGCTAGAGCTGTSGVTLATWVVNPFPVLTSTFTPPAICSGLAFSYTPTSGTAGTTFAWTRASVAGITPVGPTSGNGNPNEALTNTTTAPISVRYIYTLSANGCTNPATFNVDVVVNPMPVLTSTLTPPAICSGSAFSYTPTSGTAGTSFAWTRATVAGITPVGPTSGNSNPNEALTNTTTAPISVRYVYTLTANSCTNPTTFNVDVVVNPMPVLTSSLTPPAICSGSAFSYTPTSGTAGTTFAWTRASVAGITPVGPTSGNGNPNETLTNTTSDPITVRYIYTLSANGCTNSTTFNVDVVVNPMPALTSTLTPPAICSGSAFSYTPTSGTAGTTFAWTRATVAGITPAGPTSGNGNPNETLTNTTAAPISVRYVYTLTANGCTNPTTFNVDVVVNPMSTLTSSVTPPAICSGSAFSYTPTSGTAGTTFAWTRATVAGITPAGPTSGNGNPNETLTNTTAAPISVRYVYTLTANGCTNPTTFNVDVVVNPMSTLTSSVTPPAICSGSAFSYTPTSGTAGTSFAWTRASVAGITPVGPTSGNGNPNETLTNTTAAPISVRYVYTLTANGCTNPTTFNVDVVVNPMSTLTSSVTPPAICSGSAFSYTPTSGTAGTSFAWTRAIVAGIIPVGPTSGNGNPNEALTNTTSAPISVRYIYTLTANGCTNPTTFNVDVVVNPVAEVNQPVNKIFCNGSPTTAIIFGTTNAGGTVTYTWTNDQPGIGLAASGTGDIASFNAINNGTAPIVATIVVTPHFENGSVTCDGPTKTFTITVNPAAEVEQPVSEVVCNGAPATGVTLTTTNTGGTNTYTWTNDQPAIGLAATGTGNIPSFTAANAGTAPIVATIVVTPHFENGSVTCDGPTKTFTITVNPTGEVEQPVNIVVCNGSPASVAFATINTGGTTTYTWTNDQPSIGLAASGTGDIASFNATNAGTSPVVATIVVTPHFENGSKTCDGPAKTFTIIVNPSAEVEQPASEVVCNGAPTTAVTFTTTNTGGTVTYTWTNDQPAIGLAANGTGNIASFSATNAGTSPVVATIVVTPHFENGSVTCDGPAKTFTITVNPTAEVEQPVNIVVCNGSPASAAFSTINTGGTTTYTWTNDQPSIGLAVSGTGNITSFNTINTGATPVVATIVVTPHFENGSKTCDGPAKTFTITVNPSAEVEQPASEVVCNGVPTTAVTFTTTNTGGTVTYTWTNDQPTIGLAASGNGDIASFNANNAGTSPVVATIVVTPHFENGSATCDGATRTFTITVNPSAEVEQPASEVICNGAPTTAVTFTTTNTGGTVTYTWTNDQPAIGLALTGTGNIPSFTAINAGTAPVVASIVVTPHFENGSVTCDGPAKTFTITVNPVAEVDLPSSQVICNGAPTAAVSFTTTNTGGTVTYTWTNDLPSIGLAATGTGNIPSFTATNAGTAPVSATIVVTPHFTNGLVTCDGPAKTFTITVNPAAEVEQPVSEAVCNGAPATAVTFSTTNTGGTVTYTWTNDQPAIGLAAIGTGNILSFTAANAGTSPVVATIVVTPHFENGSVTCDGPSKTFTITVNPTAEVEQPVNIVVCNGSPASVAFATVNTGGTTTYTWTNDQPGIGLAASGTGDIASFNAINNGTAPIVATIVVTPHFENGSKTCDGPTKTFTMTVNPSAEVEQPASEVVCNGASTTAVTFTTTNTGGTNTYTWTNDQPAIGLAANGTGDIASFNAINNGTAPIVATIVVTPHFENGSATCDGSTKTFTIIVNPTAEADQPPSEVVCNGAPTTTVTFVTTNTGGTTTYTWTNDNTTIGLAATGTGDIPSFTAINAGTAPVVASIVVTPHFENGSKTCDGPARTFTITVNPSAEVEQPASEVVCNGAPTTAVTFTTTNTGGTVTYTWTNDQPTIGLAASGTGDIASFNAINNGTSPIVATIVVTPHFDQRVGNL